VTPLELALHLAERGRGTTHPNPIVGAVVEREGEVVGQGWHERKGEAHAEVHALGAAGERARGATLYVSLEPCSHHGATPPCTDAVIEAGIARVVIGARDPTPGRDGIARLKAAGIEVELADSFEARRQNEAWRTWVSHARPFVTYKVAITLDGRVVVPGSRWVTGEQSRRLVHELRAGSDAVAVGMGTVRADDPRLDARDVTVLSQPRRLVFGSGPLPGGSELELRSGPLAAELAALAAEGADRRSRRRSSPRVWSTRCCSSSPRSCRAQGHGGRAISQRRFGCRVSPRRASATTSCSRRTSTSPRSAAGGRWMPLRGW
jgi:diaminohydroxyphosphoribosylaminopyrimidine deaminase / 5-amino-6-(5-phosphoribosylamino)uracil reductase